MVPPPPTPNMEMATPEPRRYGGGGGGSCSMAGSETKKTPKTLNEMEVQFHRLQRENFDLKMTIFYQEERIRALQGGEVDTDDRLKDLEEQLIQSEYQRQELEANVEDLSDTLGKSKQIITKLKEDLQFRSQEAVELNNVNATLRQRMADLEQELRSNKGDEMHLSEKLDASQAALEARERTIRLLEEEKALAINETKTLQWQLEELNRASEELKAQHEVELARAVADKKAVEQSCHQQTSTTRKMSSDVEELRAKVRAADDQARKAELQVTEYQQRVDRFGQLIEDKQEEIQDKQEEIRALQDALQRAEAKLDEEAARYDKLVVMLENKDVELERVRNEKEGMSKADKDRVEAADSKYEAEKRMKEDLLAEISAMRQQHRKTLEDLVAHLRQFDTVVDYFLSDLLKISSEGEPLTELLIEEETSGERGRVMGWDEEVTSGTVRYQVKGLVDKWRARVKRVQAVKKHFEDTLSSVTAKHEARVKEMTDAMEAQESKIAEADLALKHAREQGEEAARIHRLELSRLEGLLEQEKERAEGRERQLREALEGKVGEVEASRKGELERYQHELQRLAHDYRSVQHLRKEAEAKATQLDEACLQLKGQVAKLQNETRDREQLKATVQHMIKQLNKRDEQITHLNRVIIQHGYNTGGASSITSLDAAAIDMMGGVMTTTTPLGEHGTSSGVVMGSTAMEELVRQQIEETRISLQKSGEQVHGEKLRLSRSGGGVGGVEDAYSSSSRARVKAELEARVDLLGCHIRDLHGLATETRELLERFDGIRGVGVGSSRYGSSASSRPAWVDPMESQVLRLLAANERLVDGFHSLCQDLQKIYRRLKSTEFGKSPLRVRENDRNIGNTNSSAPPSQHKSHGSRAPPPPPPPSSLSGSGERRNPLAPREASRSTAHYGVFDPIQSSAYSHSGGSRGASHGSGGSSSHGLMEPHQHSSSSGGGRDVRSSLSTGTTHHQPQHMVSGKQSAVHPGVHNLEKISHDLQEIAHKLELYKATASRPAEQLLSSRRR